MQMRVDAADAVDIWIKKRIISFWLNIVNDKQTKL